MGKKTRGQPPAITQRLRQIPPNVVQGGGGAVTPPPPPPPPPPSFDGVPEHVPELTFVVQRRTAGDDFINGANTYHANCGLQPQTIRSIEHLVTILGGPTPPPGSPPPSRLGRIRIVTHAHPNNMAVAMFDGSDVFFALKEYLRGFAQDDISGIMSILNMGPNAHFFQWDIFTITAHIRNSSSPNVLAPFGFGTGGTPSGDLREFIFSSSDLFFANANRVGKNGGNLSGIERAGLLAGLTQVIRLRGEALVGTTAGTHQITQPDLDALRTFLLGMTAADFGLPANARFNFTIPAGVINPFPLMGRAAEAIRNDFRSKLNRVKQRLDENSTIDIRGCRAGQDADYLEAVREFFGRTDHLPSVTAPRWYQYFGPSSFSDRQDNAQFHTLLTTGAEAPNIRAGFEDWARRTRIDPLHKTFWRDLLNGSVIVFCLMAWRNTFPRLPTKLATPGLTAFAALNFRDAIVRIRDFFNVAAASTPAGAALQTIHNFVTNSLPGFAPNLLAEVNNSTLPQRRQDIYLALQQINQTLGQTLVPAAPNPPPVNTVTDAQTALINFIETNQLAPVRAFMTAARQRIDDANESGLFYYMLHAGLPVFVFFNREQVNNHAVTVRHNRLVVLHQFADGAYRQWPPLLWQEALPAANTIGTLHPNNNDALRFAMMVEEADGGNTQVAACPHPDYMDKIRSVP